MFRSKYPDNISNFNYKILIENFSKLRRVKQFKSGKYVSKKKKKTRKIIISLILIISD